MKVEYLVRRVLPMVLFGQGRLEQALANFEHRDQVEVVWHSFQLDPDARKSHRVHRMSY